jgi:hypothetical protein
MGGKWVVLSVLLSVAVTICGCGSSGGNNTVLPNQEDPIYPQIPEGPVYYVDRSIGKDENPGSEEEPWATIQHAVGKATPGDTIIVKGNSKNSPLLYDEWVKTPSGLPARTVRKSLS